MKIQQEIYFSIIPQTLTQSNVSDSAYRVYGTLCRFANKDNGSCFPSIATIGKFCGKSPSTVKRAVKELKESGFIEVIERFETDKGQTSNLYIVKFISAKNNTGRGFNNATGGMPEVVHKPESINQSQDLKSHMNELFNTLVYQIGYKPKTKSEESGWYKVAKELAQANASADELADRIQVFKKQWKDMTLTPYAVNKNWGLLGQMVLENKEPVPYDCSKQGCNWIDLDVIWYCQYCKSEKSK